MESTGYWSILRLNDCSSGSTAFVSVKQPGLSTSDYNHGTSFIARLSVQNKDVVDTMIILPMIIYIIHEYGRPLHASFDIL